jgi:hypothetical protein
MRLRKINSTAKMAKPLTDVRIRAQSSKRGRPQIINMRGRGGQVPPGAVYVGRAQGRVGLRQSKWANPFLIGRDGARYEVIEQYRAWLLRQHDLMAALPELRGKDLACWCVPERCPAEVLIELAAANGR